VDKSTIPPIPLQTSAKCLTHGHMDLSRDYAASPIAPHPLGAWLVRRALVDMARTRLAQLAFELEHGPGAAGDARGDAAKGGHPARAARAHNMGPTDVKRGRFPRGGPR
jgi:hypothetical protein